MTTSLLDEPRTDSAQRTSEGVDLGPFAIHLNLNELDDAQPYTIEALDATPAACNDAIVHPHVQSRRLCEGEGRPAIQRALQEGRIGEFFVLVRQVLRTYNDHSAYVGLDNWHGISCVGCADAVPEDDSSTCDRCQCSLCSDCCCSCSDCDVTLCYDCAAVCDGCEQRYCRHCLIRCTDCAELFCRDCLDDGRCSTCHDTDEEVLDAQPPDPSADPTPSTAAAPQTIPTTTDPQVQSHRLGQATASA